MTQNLILFLGSAAALILGLVFSRSPVLHQTEQSGLAGIQSGESSIHPRRRISLPVFIAFAAVILGLAIRIYGVDFGLPYPYHPDELRKTGLLNKMANRSSLRPIALLHPPLLLYLTIAMRKFLDASNLVENSWSGMVRFLLAGRLVSVIAGTATIAVVYAVGKRFRSPLVGAGAALIVAFAPLHITCSRYLKEDILFTFCFTVAVWLVISALKTGRKDFLYWAGLACGASAASKYSGLVSGAVLLPAVLAEGRIRFGGNREALKAFLVACCCIVIGFAIFSPYVLIYPLDYYYGFKAEAGHATGGHNGSIITAWSQLWVYHLGRSLIPGVGAGCVFLGLIGAGLAIGRRDPLGWTLVLPLAAFYLTAEYAKSKPFPNPDRYVVQCIPLLAILSIYAIDTIAAAVRRNLGQSSKGFGLQVLIALLALGIVVQPIFRAIALASEIRFDTRQQMRRFIATNIPRGTRITTIGGSVYLPRLPHGYSAISLRKIIGGGEQDFGARLDTAGVKYLLVTEMANRRFKVGEFENSRFYRMLGEIEKRYDVAVKISSKYGSNAFHNPELSLYRLKQLPKNEQPNGG